MGSCFTNQAEPIPIIPILPDSDSNNVQTNPNYQNNNQGYTNRDAHQQDNKLGKQALLNLQKNSKVNNGNCLTNQLEQISIKPIHPDTNPSYEQTNNSSGFSKDTELAKQILLNLSKNDTLDEQKLIMIQKNFKGSLKTIHQYSRSLSSAENILNEDSFQCLKYNFKSHYFNNQEAQWLLDFLQRLVDAKQMVQVSQLSQITKKVEQLGIDYHQNLNKIHFRHYKAIKIVEKLFSHSKDKSQSINLNELKYDLFDQQEILKVSKIVKLCCEQDLDAFFFLSAYLKESCIKMGMNHKCKVIQIEKRLLDVLEFLRNKHPPNDQIPNVNVNLKIEQNEKLSHTLKINLKVVEPNKRVQILESFIIQVAEIAKKNLKYLTQITKQACQKNNGTQFKTGLKVKDKSNKSSIERVKEKLLNKAFQGRKYKIPGEINSIQQVLTKQNEHYNKNIALILNQLTQDIEFTVSDMLRGKCMFENLLHLKKAAEEIAKNSNQRGYSFEVDNRLIKPTTDLVFKIKIGETIAEFQLAYKFNVVKNQFNHKIYELARSKFYNALSTLFIFDQKSIQFIDQTLCRTAKLNQQKIEVRIRFIEQQALQQIGELRKQFDKFCIQKRYKLSDQDKRNQQIKDSLIQAIKALMNNKQIVELANKKKKENEEVVLYLNAIFLQKIQLKQAALQCYLDLKKVLQNYQNLSKNQKELQCTISQKVAKNWMDIGYLDQALDEFQKCLNMQKNIKGEECIDIANTLSNIGNVHFDQGNNPEALKYYEKCLKIKINLKGPQSIDLIQTYNSIGLVYYKKGNNPEALKYYEICLNIQKNTNEEDSIDIAQTYNNIGLVYYQMGNDSEALKYYEKSLKIKINLKGEDSFCGASTLNNIANIYKNQGNYPEALKYYQKSLKIKVNVKGPESIELAPTIGDIGSIHDGLGNYKTALQYYQMCLKLQTHRNKNKSIDVAETYKKIGNIYKKQGNIQKAFNYFEISLQKTMNVMGTNSIEVALAYSDFGSLLDEIENYTDALQYYQMCLNIQKNLIGVNSIEAAETLKKIENNYQKQRQYQKALKYYQICLQIENNAKGKDSVDVEMYQQALETFEEVYKRRLSILGPNDPNVHEILQKIEVIRSKNKN